MTTRIARTATFCMALVAAFLLGFALDMPARTQTSPDAGQLEANKQLLLDFFAFQGGTREERSELFMVDDYIQHNPRFLRMDEITGATGREAWLRAGEEGRNRRISLVDLGGIPLRDPVIVMAEGDLVTAIYKGVLPDPDDASRTYEAFAFETVRVRDGKFAEHWDQVALAEGWMEPRQD